MHVLYSDRFNSNPCFYATCMVAQLAELLILIGYSKTLQGLLFYRSELIYVAIYAVKCMTLIVLEALI